MGSKIALTDEQYFVAMGIAYLRVFRFEEGLGAFSKRCGIDPVRLSHLGVGREYPTPEEFEELRAVHASWRPKPTDEPGDPIQDDPYV